MMLSSTITRAVAIESRLKSPAFDGRWTHIRGYLFRSLSVTSDGSDHGSGHDADMNYVCSAMEKMGQIIRE